MRFLAEGVIDSFVVILLYFLDQLLDSFSLNVPLQRRIAQAVPIGALTHDK